jgi:hypothetical protein
MTRSLVEKYEEGRITDDHLVVECLCTLDPKNPSVVLEPLADHVQARMLRFAKEFDAEKMLTNFGALPAPEQVLAARKWLDVWMKKDAHRTSPRPRPRPAAP